MGQQQVLLLVLVFCILGILLSLRMITVDSESEGANRDAVIKDMYTIASKAQQYYHRSLEQGGGDQSFLGLARGLHGIRKLGSASSTAYGEYFVWDPGNTKTVQLLGVGIERGLDPRLPVRVVMTVWSDSVAFSILN